ncbi:Ger(x)C family spore germination protein [Paenibacillus anseongense]|uniref:Ger(x)C family spore germination protein n=1 Tax=Paenibacillus anseongense TaxID=2682845 RepID=UPI002DB7FFED|nr:Ger(x)C family spore germination protein [Paenibacillus anseongense]MEC0270975.1 Ger(x)C family spore germination protein [Paenibacillus anseongense]
MKMSALALLVCILLSGCAKKEIIDRIKILQSVSLDVDQGETFKASASYASYKKNAQLQLLTAEAQTFSGVWLPHNMKSEELVVYGQLRGIVISEKLARRSIQELVSTLLVDPVISNNTFIVIAKKEVTSIISNGLKKPSFYMSELIKQNMNNGNTPSSNSHLLLDQYYGEGQDVYLPGLDLDDKGLLHLNGVGIFKGDKLRLWLTNQEAFFLKLLKDRSKTMTGSYEFSTKQKDTINMKILHGKRNISPKRNATAFISLKLQVNLKSLPKTKSPVVKSDLLEVKQQIENHFAGEVSDLLKKLQQNEVDPIGFGEIFRSKDRSWSEKEFMKNTYPNIKFEVKPEINILQTGVGISAEQR